MTELPKTGNRRVDLAMQLIFDTTGMDPQKFLNFLGKSNKKVKLQASTNEEISEALRMLSTPKKDKAEYIKSVFQDPDQRKNRSILINYYKNDKGLIDFTKQIKKEFLQPKKTTFVPASNQYGVVGSKMIPVKTSQLEPETVQKFAKLFNLNNPFITRTLKENLTAAEYRSVRETSELRKLLDPVAIKTQKKISGSVTNFPFDLIVDRAEQVLRTYKKLIPEATGRELKLAPGMFGEIDINAVFQTDPVLAEFIKIGARQQSKGTQRDIQRGLGINQGAVRKIMNQLNREGTIKELGLDQYYFLGGNPKPVKIADPDVKKFMEDEAKSVGYSLKMRDLTGILDPDQLAYISDVRKNINDIVKPLSTKPKMTEFVTTRKTFYKSVDDIIENTLTAAAQANDPATIKLIKDKRIPQNLMVAQLLRNELQLAGENIGVLPVSFKQAKEMADAMNQIGFKTQNQTAKLKIDNIQNIAEGMMDSFEVQLETGQRVSVGQLFVEQADGSLRSTQEILNEGKARWTEYKRRFYDDETISTWLGWKDQKARKSVGVSSDYPLGIDYGKNAPINWLDFNKISNMKPDEKTKFSRSLQEALGVPDASGTNYRIRVDTEDGQATSMILEARTREWLTQTILSGEPIDFNNLRRQMKSIQDTFTGVTEDGKQVNLINLDRVMTDVFPEFGKNSVDPQYFELGVKKLKDFAKGEADRIVREATVIKKGIEDSSNFLRRFSRGELDSRSVGTTLISGGVGRLQDLKKHLKSLGRNEQETNDIIRSLLVQEMDNKAFRATGQYSIDPTNPNVMIPNVDLNIEALKDFMGYADKSQEAVVREIIGDKQYDTYKAIINFTANEVVDSAGRTNITGIPRQFSVESYISRFYAVNRGVVSFRYVGTEAILQQMRQKNMSLLTVALTDPKIGGLLMEMVDTGKPLPMDKERQLFEALVVASERFDNWRETSKDPIKVSSDYGHEFIYMNGKSLYEQVVGKPK
jgi:hypothetical protein